MIFYNHVWEVCGVKVQVIKNVDSHDRGFCMRFYGVFYLICFQIIVAQTLYFGDHYWTLFQIEQYVSYYSPVAGFLWIVPVRLRAPHWLYLDELIFHLSCQLVKGKLLVFGNTQVCEDTQMRTNEKFYIANIFQKKAVDMVHYSFSWKVLESEFRCACELWV